MMPIVLWASIIQNINEMFFGDGAGVEGIFGSLGEGVGVLLLGFIILMFFIIMTAVYGMGIVVGSVILIPASFIVFRFVPPLWIIVAIVSGLTFGYALWHFFQAK